MALLIAYTLHDVKALSYSPPFFTTNDMVARRMVSDLVNDKNTSVGRHPADYKLYKIGTFDEGNAVMTPCRSLSMSSTACRSMPIRGSRRRATARPTSAPTGASNNADPFRHVAQLQPGTRG